MVESTEILVIGGGPGGLACATLLAHNGAKVILAERKAVIGPKVCAGGITWGGLIKHIPERLIERPFPEQQIVTPWQHIVVTEKNPIIATVSRQRLGQWMAEQAQAAGVTVLTGTRALSLENNRASLEREDGQRITIGFDHLVGADGSHSLVRRFLGLPVHAMGIGINCMLPGQHRHMEWHLHAGRFGSGYGWIFPHAEVVSIGAYGDVNNLSAPLLKKRLLAWAGSQGFRLDPDALRAGLVNFDYRGLRFDRTWLVGDAAGLASGLTGEGIYPALISGRAVARMILDPGYRPDALAGMLKKQRRHRKMVALSGKNRHLCRLLPEVMVLLLRWKIINFHTLEMAE